MPQTTKDPLNSREIMEMMKEHGETVAKNTASEFFKKVVDYMGCRENCLIKSEEMFHWMGFVRIRKKLVPLTYLLIAAMAIAGFFLGIYNI